MKLKFFVEGRNQLYIYRVEGTLKKKQLNKKIHKGIQKLKEAEFSRSVYNMCEKKRKWKKKEIKSTIFLFLVNKYCILHNRGDFYVFCSILLLICGKSPLIPAYRISRN